LDGAAADLDADVCSPTNVDAVPAPAVQDLHAVHAKRAQLCRADANNKLDGCVRRQNDSVGGARWRTEGRRRESSVRADSPIAQ
jgi:hypothetical protein